MKLVESLMPDLFHVIPVDYNTILDGVLEGQHIALDLGFAALSGVGERVVLPDWCGCLPDIVAVLTGHTDRIVGIVWATDDGPDTASVCRPRGDGT